MITREQIEEWKWKGIQNLEPSQVKELLELAEMGILPRNMAEALRNCKHVWRRYLMSDDQYCGICRKARPKKEYE